MEDQSLAAIRETNRKTLKLNRRFQRDEETDFRRPAVQTSITPETIEAIADRLKTKSPITEAELQTLKNGLIEDSKLIEVVLNTHGTLRGLIRELTGSEVKKQCAAAGCLCNLGLAESKGSCAVAKAAGPYLITALDSLTTELAVCCAWAVGNLAGSSTKASELLIAQGAVAKLCHLLYSTTNEELKDAAIYALVHFAYQMRDLLSPEYLAQIIDALSKSDISIASCQLLFILSCHNKFPCNKLPENYLQKLSAALLVSIPYHIKNCHNNCSKDCILLYLIRIFGNTPIDDKIYANFVECFSKSIEGFKMLIVKNDVVGNSVCWLIGNLYNYNSDHVFFNELLR